MTIEDTFLVSFDLIGFVALRDVEVDLAAGIASAPAYISATLTATDCPIAREAAIDRRADAGREYLALLQAVARRRATDFSEPTEDLHPAIDALFAADTAATFRSAVSAYPSLRSLAAIDQLRSYLDWHLARELFDLSSAVEQATKNNRHFDAQRIIREQIRVPSPALVSDLDVRLSLLETAPDGNPAAETVWMARAQAWFARLHRLDCAGVMITAIEAATRADDSSAAGAAADELADLAAQVDEKRPYVAGDWRAIAAAAQLRSVISCESSEFATVAIEKGLRDGQIGAFPINGDACLFYLSLAEASARRIADDAGYEPIADDFLGAALGSETSFVSPEVRLRILAQLGRQVRRRLAINGRATGPEFTRLLEEIELSQSYGS